MHGFFLQYLVTQWSYLKGFFKKILIVFCLPIMLSMDYGIIFATHNHIKPYYFASAKGKILNVQNPMDNIIEDKMVPLYVHIKKKKAKSFKKKKKHLYSLTILLTISLYLFMVMVYIPATGFL